MPPDTTPAELIEKIEKCVNTNLQLTAKEAVYFRQIMRVWEVGSSMAVGVRWIFTGIGVLAAFVASLMYFWALFTGSK